MNEWKIDICVEKKKKESMIIMFNAFSQVLGKNS
jgi:hypothetical protein